MTNTTLTSIGKFEAKNTFHNALIQNGIAYLPAGNQGLLLLDVKNANEPKLLKQFESIGYVYDVAIFGKNAFVASENEGLKILDISTPSKLNLISTFTESISNLQQVALAGNTAYLADWQNGLLIVDVQNLNAPKKLAQLPLSHAKNVTLGKNNTLALVITDSSTLVTVDITDDFAPKKLSEFKLGFDVREIAVIDENFLAVAGGEEGLKIIDMSNASAPKLVGQLNQMAFALTVIDSQTLVLASGAKGAVLVDVSNYAAPLVKNSISATNATEITSDGTTIYLLDNAKNTQKLQILSSDPFATDKKPFEMQRENPNFQGKGENADNVKGSQTHDSIWGGSGNDTLKGASGNDSIDGHNGDDKLFGEDDNDLLLGGNGNDVLNGGDGDDTLQGGAGNDTLDGSNGADQMEGGEGDDYYVVDNLGDVIIEDSSSKGGIDTVEISVQIPRAFIGVENYLIKSERDINVAGDDNPNQITGGSGNNYLRGNGGNDTLIGGSGDDTLEGGKNIDRLDGGAGNDTYIIENDEDFIIDTQGENQVQSSKTISITTYDAIKNLELTGNAAVDGTGNDKNNFIEGNENNNKLDGRKGNDTIYAGGGDDTLIGGSGGNDFLDGGNGEDLVRYDKPQSDFDPKFIDGVYVVTHIQSGNKDELHNVEYLQFADSALIPIQSTSQKTLKFSVVDAFTQEGKEAILTLKLDSPAEEDVKINVQTVDSTAKKGVDYEKSSEVVIFSASQTTKTLKIKTTQNQLVEDDKKFMVNFSSDDENVQIQTPTAFVTIEDDDKPKISIASAKITEGQAGKSLVDVTVSLSAPAKQTVKVLCETSDGTAKNSTDYEATRKTLEILAGKKTAKFSVPIVDDKISESLESFFVNLSNPQNATIDPKKSVATVEIIDNDSNTSAALQIALVGSQNIIDVTQ